MRGEPRACFGALGGTGFQSLGVVDESGCFLVGIGIADMSERDLRGEIKKKIIMLIFTHFYCTIMY